MRKMESKQYKEQINSTNKVCEQIAMTYGMSESLINSGLLSKVSGWNIQDKRCLLRYLSEEVETERIEEDEWDLLEPNDLEPYTFDELHARINESHQQYLRGEFQTEAEVREELKKEFQWLQ